jgi:hypothetical protein
MANRGKATEEDEMSEMNRQAIGRKTTPLAKFLRRLAWTAPVVAALGLTGSAFGAYSAFVLYPLNAPSGMTSFTVGGLAQTTSPAPSSGAYVVGSGSGPGTGGFQNAIVWDNGGNPINLNPSNLLGPSSVSTSFALGTGGGMQVGYINGGGTAFADNAAIWTSNSAGSAADIHPLSGAFITSYAYSTYGGTLATSQQIGEGAIATGSNPVHAILWNQGDPNQANDLNPTNLSGYTTSNGRGIKGNYAVGMARGSVPTGGNNHAMLWTGGATPATDANTAVDLNPTNLSGYNNSTAWGTTADGVQQVGQASGTATANKPHAMLWAGSSSTAVDLGLGQTLTILGAGGTSVANDTNGTNQVGYGFGPTTSNKNHALLWAGLASSTIDLNALLPAGYSSIANTIDAAGDVFGTATDATGHTFAVEWSTAASVPEPASLSILALGGACLMQRRRRSAAKVA